MAYDIREKMVEQDGMLHVVRSQDVEALLDENKALADIAPSAHGDAKFRLAGRIPMVVVEQWMKECGHALGSPGLNDYVKKKLMDGDFARFRVKGF